MKKIISIILVIVVLISFGACSANKDAEYYSESMQESEEAPQQLDEAHAVEEDFEELYSEATEESATALPILTPDKAGGKKITYDVTMILETEEFMKGIRHIITTLGDMDGYVEHATVNGREMFNRTEKRSSTYSLRVPVESLAEFMVIMEDSYNLVHMSQVSNDITASVAVTTSEQDSLLEEKKILEESLGAELTDEEQLQIQESLADVNVRIANLSTTKNSMDDKIAYSSVTIELREVISEETIEKIYEEEESRRMEKEAELLANEPHVSFGTRVNNQTKTSTNSLLSFLQSIIIVIIAIAPFLIIISLLLLVVFFFRKTSLYKKINERLGSEKNSTPSKNDDNNTVSKDEQS